MKPLLAAICLLPSLALAQDLPTLYQWMQGSFSSETQAQRDDDYHPILLHMAPIWTERKDGLWLYVEQALKSKTPYRQRVYQLTETSDGHFISAVYTIDEPSRMVGAWEDEAQLQQLEFAQINLKAGCEITLLWQPQQQRFTGATEDDNCKSKLYGASYATATTVITANQLVSWDRGFDSEGKHKWGATKGGYRFDKLGY
ncbi:chromophore lyase CpcT/CpeT [Ferrimonas lipolytica]|uniref:CpeT/CpcT family n=1 Tax=Ferrimonas lipolytica TaxID=2724191 RepID=A0A6H1UHP2_9GAMM|nr:chromophore lyase CpcT/CpeT [Ferrimonas lipolytica]QIZ78564.1 hypothetical protein HER31_17655 [Ferrimonas lipolytica]